VSLEFIHHLQYLILGSRGSAHNGWCGWRHINKIRLDAPLFKLVRLPAPTLLSYISIFAFLMKAKILNAPT
jgi:hypothetical protein